MEILLHPALIAGAATVLFASALAAFFFVFTRGALMLRTIRGKASGAADHIYPVYSEMWLIRLLDFQPIISAILLFQYKAMVDRIVEELRDTVLSGKRVLITSCAFGNVIPRIVCAAGACGAHKVIIADLLENELINAKRKLDPAARIELAQENAVAMDLANGVVQVNILFFLLHELPHHLKVVALHEAARVTRSGGKLIIAEFHKPTSPVLRMLSRLYFLVFEPYGLALWDEHDPVWHLEKDGEWTCTRDTFCFGNYQLIVATKR
ncbi:MAG TPA: class I SAM-dependent methyltransferase [Candidatus Paceibacterota bacterium]|nr:class I SAM-dependent methyltransferase [Candidatus Paceibacterota bacterium]